MAIGFGMLVALSTVGAQIATYTAETSPARPGIAVVHTGEAYPAEAVAILTEVAEDGGLAKISPRKADTASAFREAVRASRASVLVLAGHGEPDGFYVNRERIPWPDLAQDVAASGAREVLFLSCYSEAVGNVPGVRVTLAYDDLVDLEIAALDAAYEIGAAHLAGEPLDRFAEAHTAYVETQGGAEWVFARLMEPKRALEHRETGQYPGWDGRECGDQWNEWNYPAQNGEKQGGCSVATIDPLNHNCNRDSGCKETAQEQRKWEERMEQNSAAEVKFPPGLTFLKDRLAITQHVELRGVQFDWFIELGQIKALTPYTKAKEARDDSLCYEIIDFADVAIPGLTKVIESLEKIPGVKNADFDGGALELCAAIGGGIPTSRAEGYIEGTLTAKGTAGVQLHIKKWWISSKFTAGVTLSYPLGVEATIKYASGTLVLDMDFKWGPLGIQAQAGIFSVYVSVDAAFFAGKTDMLHFEWCIACSSTSNAGAPLPVPDLDLNPERLANLPAAAVQVRDEAEVAKIIDERGVGIQIADLMTLEPGDMFFNHLKKNGGFDRLGLDVENLAPGQAVVLDLGSPDVYRALYEEETERPLTLYGLPDGFAVVPASNSCEVRVVEGVIDVAAVDTCESGAQVLVGDTAGVVTTGLDALNSGEDTGDSLKGIACPAGSSATACDTLAKISSVAEGNALVEKVLEAHSSKLILEDYGIFLWLKDACSETAGDSAGWTGLCGYFEPKTEADAYELTLSQVEAQYEQGLLEILSLALTVSDHVDYWLQDNTGGDPVPEPDIEELGETLHQLECDLWEALGEDPC